MKKSREYHHGLISQTSNLSNSLQKSAVWCLSQSATAAMTKHHRLSGLSNTYLYSSGGYPPSPQDVDAADFVLGENPLTDLQTVSSHCALTWWRKKEQK